MKRLTITSLCMMVALMFCVSPAMAYEIYVYTGDPDPIQDDWQLRGEVHELGNQFPPDELIDSVEVDWGGHIPCRNEFVESAVQVQIVNLTNTVFSELYYVADLEATTMTNYDELVGQVDAAGNATPLWLAFKIDAVGENTPLVYESRSNNGLFEPGEVWEFVIQDYRNALGLSPAAFWSRGIAAFSSQDDISSGSLITPEPTTIALLGFGSLALLRKRKA